MLGFLVQCWLGDVVVGFPVSNLCVGFLVFQAQNI